MKLANILAFVFVLVCFTAQSQTKDPMITFDKESHDFGKIKEEAGSVSRDFNFVNTGGTPLIINNVQASCGCTTPNWTKAPIPPGGKGFVSASFNPEGRPGSFQKTITVTCNALNSPLIIKISGEVIPRNATDNKTNTEYPENAGTLQMKTSAIVFSKITNIQQQTQEIDIFNPGPGPAKINFENVPAYISVSTQPPFLRPNEKGKIIIKYDASKKNDYGFVVDKLTLMLNGKKEGNGIMVTANIEEDFSKLSASDLTNAPVMEFDTKAFNLKDMKLNETRNVEFKITNTGKKALLIRKITNYCNCAEIVLQPKEIAPGKTEVLKLKFTAKEKGMQKKNLTIYSNDPKNSKTILWMNGLITE